MGSDLVKGYAKNYGSHVEYRNSSSVLHRDFDRPAVEHVNGDKEWYTNGQRHREDGPAVERADGSREWWVYGQLHREDGAAIELASGAVYWFINGKSYNTEKEYAIGMGLFRTVGNWEYDSVVHECSAYIEWKNLKGERHRVDGPAVEKVNRDEWYQAGKCHKIVWSDGHDKEWWFEGKKHRLDGPAIEKANGRKIWYIEGKEYTEEEFNKYVKDNG